MGLKQDLIVICLIIFWFMRVTEKGQRSPQTPEKQEFLENAIDLIKWKHERRKEFQNQRVYDFSLDCRDITAS